MVYAGIDIGAQSVKAAVFDGRKVLGWKCEMTEEGADAAARVVYGELLKDLGINMKEVDKVLATGWGAAEISFADGKSSEQVCAARGARWYFPSARTVVDVGAEGCRVMKLSRDGVLEDFVNNSKCASGTGGFIELGAVYLKASIEEMDSLALAAKGAAEISSTCAVFAESVIISQIHEGESRERIAAGIHRAAAARILELAGRMGLVKDVVLIGGAALNAGLVKAMEEMGSVSFLIPEHPRIVGAVGAAIQASMKKGRRSRAVPAQ